MSERRDDTTEPAPESLRERESESRNYYYDDGTGYEVFDPEASEGDAEEEDAADEV